MNYTILILFAFFFASIGFITALLITRLREPESGAPSKLRRGSPLREYRIPSPSSRSGALQIWNDPQSGELFVELEGQIFSSVSQMSMEQRRILSIKTGELVSWLSQAVIQPPPQVIRPAVSSPLTAVPRKAEQPPKPTFRSTFFRTARRDLSKEPSHSTTLADQVDEILQEKLAHSPLAHRVIRLVSLPDHGLAVEVDHKQYDHIDDVPDDDVRQLLREAVAEWQRRSKRGGIG